MTENHDRRVFLHGTSAILTSATALGVHVVGAEEASKKKVTLNLGIIGCGGIMTHHVKGLVGRRESVSISWLCDVDPGHIELMSRHIIQGFQSSPPKRSSKFEDVIGDKNVDACIIATPHHWHTVLGKDIVYTLGRDIAYSVRSPLPDACLLSSNYSPEGLP